MRALANVTGTASVVLTQKRSRVNVMMSTTALSAAFLLTAGLPAQAQTADAEVAEEIVVTGSRIVREGYEAPTPLTVVGAEALEKSPDMNLASFLATMPAITGSQLATSGQNQVAGAIGGIQALNLRSLGSTRVLVLLDGQRTVGSSYGGLVDITTFPSQLVQRVDVVTGGASAVYGSDAVAGVVNFVLDRQFTGVKGELSGGLTNYGDDKNYKVNMSSGFGFSGGRGHVLLSGEHMHNDGIQGDGGDAGRDWTREGWQQLTNPTYTATNGQPLLLFLPQSSVATATAGGIVVSGPLKGTAFGQGGLPYQFQYGPIFSSPLMSGGGDWKENSPQRYFDRSPSQSNQSIFTRVSYDLADNLSAFVQYGWSQNKMQNIYNYAWYFGGPTGPIVQVDNAFLPASVRAAMVANNLTSLQVGTYSTDYPAFGNTNARRTNRINAGLNGSFDAFDSEWNWDAYYAYGSTKIKLHNRVPILSRFRQALDAVVNPANGQIVCRSVLNGTNPDCRPWNIMGVGVNDANSASIDWINGGLTYQHGLVEQQTFAASVTGEPFSSWAGPVSLALSAEHRTDEIHATVDAGSLAFAHVVGNYAPIDGKQSVTEGAIETLVPLAAGESWAQAWDLSAAVRFTDYQFAGYVTTWKLGSTYTLNDQIRFRVTRSRDIRAPSIQETFAAPAATTPGSGLIDRFLNNASTQSTTQQVTSGNPTLLPEKADTTGVGVVLTPAFLQGFTMSADFWNVNLKGAIQPLTGQQVIDSCFTGKLPALCANIIRDSGGLISQIRTYSVNLTRREVRGIDLEASYRVPLADIADGLDGNFSLHGLMTLFLRDYEDNTFRAPVNRAGENGADAPPDWKLNVTASYQLDPVTLSLTGRAVSSGTINNSYIACTTGCPTSTPDNQTINTNFIAGRFYMDANMSYKILLGDTTESDVFFSVKNVFNNSPPPTVIGFNTAAGLSATLYDALGTVYRAGIRFKM